MQLNRKILGFSLTEVMIVVAIVAAFGVWVSPSFTQFINKTKLTSELNLLHAHLQLAKTTAATELVYVVFCPSNNNTQCGDDWAKGAILFLDKNHNNIVDETDRVFRVYQSESPVTLSVNRTRIVFSPINLSMTSAATVSLCINNQLKKALVISNVGRIRVKEQEDEIQCQHS